MNGLKRIIVPTVLLVLVSMLLAASANAFVGRFVGRAALTGTLSSQTVKTMGSVFFSEGEDNAVVCVTLSQSGHKATGCSKNLRNPGTESGEVQFPVTLNGSGFTYGKATLFAVATYDEDGVPGDTYRWPNQIMLVP